MVDVDIRSLKLDYRSSNIQYQVPASNFYCPSSTSYSIISNLPKEGLNLMGFFVDYRNFILIDPFPTIILQFFGEVKLTIFLTEQSVNYSNTITESLIQHFKRILRPGSRPQNQGYIILIKVFPVVCFS